MTVYFISLILFVALCVSLLWYSERGCDGRHIVSAILGVVGCIISFIGLVCAVFIGLEWAGAQHRADIINREYGTNYTQAEVFYASGVIDTVRELDRKRYEVNGDLFREGEKK